MPFAQDSTGRLPRPARVAPVNLSRLAQVGKATAASSDPIVTGVSAASERVRPGDLFAGVPGRQGHGARFSPDAVAAGAVAVLTDEPGRGFVPPGVPVMIVADVRSSLAPVAAEVYGRPSSEMNVVGVTGTSGKTTTTFLIRAGLHAAGRSSGLIGTVATFIGDEPVQTGFTTPEAPDLQALLAVMRDRDVRDVAMEVSSHALAMHRVESIDFAIAAFTNLSQDHLDFHADMADYFEAKARLFDSDAWPLIVIDDEWGRRLVDRVGDCTTVGTQPGSDATWTAREIEESTDGSTRFRAVGPASEVVTGCAMPGRFNVANTLLALAILDRVGVPVDVAAAAIATASVPGRMERIEVGQRFLAIVDYSHKPAAIDNALQSLRPLTSRRLIVVLGCGGDRDRAKRAIMGEIAARGSDLLIVTDDNPRTEDAAGIRRAMLDGARTVPAGARGELREIGDRREAIRSAVAAASLGDTVLVAGKGHETGQEVNGVVHPFDDRDVLRDALRQVVS